MSLFTVFGQVTVTPDQLNIPTTELNGGHIHTVLQIVFALASAVALIIIVLSGLQFILSSGDPQKTSKARNTIIYALIGLVVCILSFSIVTFVVNKI